MCSNAFLESRKKLFLRIKNQPRKMIRLIKQALTIWKTSKSKKSKDGEEDEEKEVEEAQEVIHQKADG